MLILEVGLLLDKSLEYYQEILKNAGAVNEFNCETHDLYWSNKTQEDFEQMTENQIKKACVRFRMCVGFGGEKLEKKKSIKTGKFDNYQIFDEKKDDRFGEKISKIKKYNKIFEKNGWRLVFDTIKKDYQYSIGDMKSRIQLQEIEDVGLLLYYDNPDYYDMSEENQREMLLKELNEYGFNFEKEELGVDKFRTLLTGSTQYSKNQNG